MGLARTFLLFGLAACLAQEPPNIKVSVRLVNVALTARDSRGAFVKDLTKDDIEILDDGVPQTISHFSRGADHALTLGLVVDVSGSQHPFIKRHEHDLKVFLQDVLSARDRAFLVCFGNHLRLARDPSSSPRELLEGLKRFDKESGSMRELGPKEIRELGTAFYDAVYYPVSEILAKAESGRKALIVFSDGEDNSSAHHMLDAIEMAQTENVVVYGIRYTEVKRGRITARNKYGMRVMERLTRETGGMDFDAEKADMHDSFRKIADELRSSYDLAYYSSHAPQDGTFHKLQIRIKRPGLVARTKTGYFAGE